MAELVATPLRPAGHLPHKWGDRIVARFCQTRLVLMEKDPYPQPIFPLAGEMPGRAEGGEPHPLRPETLA